MTKKPQKSGRRANCVYLVGAGPGDVGLVTLKARELITEADLIVYDYLCNPELLQWAKPGAEVIYAGKAASAHTLTQDQINQLLIDQARAGKVVVRLKGGDPYVFGRGGEEALELIKAGLEFEEVPGVTSAIAAPAYAGIPVTHREHTSLVTFVTGHEDPTKEASAIPWKHLAHLEGTLVFLMGVERLRSIAQQLLQNGANPHLPVALVRWGTTPQQQSIEGTLSTIGDIAEQQNFRPPAIIVMGDVVRLRSQLNWFESLPLHGQRVVVTRTREQSSRLSQELRRKGADVLEIPTIHIQPTPWQEFQLSQLSNLSDHFDWVVFTSPNGAEFFFKQLMETACDVRALGQVQLAVVGPSTAERLREFHVQPALMPTTYGGAELGQALLAKLGAQAKGQRVLLVQGNRNDPELAEMLKAAGCQVTGWQLYETVPYQEKGTVPSSGRSRFERDGAHWILFASSSAVEHWNPLKLVAGAGIEPKVISMGPMTSEALKAHGFSDWIEASEATIQGMVEALCKAVG